jgi:hypothetical protein
VGRDHARDSGRTPSRTRRDSGQRTPRPCATSSAI